MAPELHKAQSSTIKAAGESPIPSTKHPLTHANIQSGNFLLTKHLLLKLIIPTHRRTCPLDRVSCLGIIPSNKGKRFLADIELERNVLPTPPILSRVSARDTR